MKNKIKFCAVLIILFLFNINMSAQQKLKGRVVDDSGVSLPGVSVMEKGTTNGTSTDENGNYEVSLKSENSTLVFSFVGFKTVELQTNGKSLLDVTMQSDAVGLDELVVVGYGVQKKANLTGAVISVKKEQLEKVSTSNATELLQGQVAGLLTKQSSGLPGEDNATLRIRGYGNPLVLVDGVQRPLSSIDPDMIESISVLKDASAAIYGARSGNGVILVKTKRGKNGEKIRVSYNGSLSLQQFTHKPGIITNSGDYTELWREAELNSGVNPTYSEEEIQKYKQGDEGYGSHNWFDYTFKDWSKKQRHSLNIYGGSDKVNFFVGLAHTDQESVITSDDYWYKRYNLRSNIDAQINKNLKMSLDLNYIHEEQSKATNNIWRGVYNSQPMAETSFGDDKLVPVSNLRGTQERLVGEMNKDIEGGVDIIPQSFNGKLKFEYSAPWVEGLKANASVDYFVTNKRIRTIKKSYELYKRNPETLEVEKTGQGPGGFINSFLKVDHHKFVRIIPKVQIEYEKEFGNHYVKSLVLGEFIDNNTNNISGETQNLLSDELMYLGYGDQVYHRLGQGVEEASRASFAGRFNYNYKKKYLLEATFRYDASSVFPENSRWGFFPSFSAGWRVSEEEWMKNISWLDNLKLRASYSETGYDANAIRYDYFSGYQMSSHVTDAYIIPVNILGNTAYRKIGPTTIANPDMTWETMKNYNAGFDLNILNGKLNLVVEGFYRKRSGVLDIPVKSYPKTFGAALSKYNLNSLDNRGFEVEVGHSNKIGDLKYNIKGTFTYAREKWIHKEEEEYKTEDEIRISKLSGKWVNRAVGYVSDGIFKSQDEIDNHKIDQDQSGNSTLKPGDIKYVDLNGDKIITWADQKEIGYNPNTSSPELNFGLNMGCEYKGFTLDVLLHGASMFSGYVGGFAQTPFDNGSTPLTVHYKERYHPEKNPGGELPAVFMGVRGNNTKFSDFWLKDISFLRLKNVNLSYTVPKKLINRYNIERVKLFVSGSNLAVWSNLGIYSKEFDPESALQHGGYPPHRTITFGLNVTF